MFCCHGLPSPAQPNSPNSLKPFHPFLTWPFTNYSPLSTHGPHHRPLLYRNQANSAVLLVPCSCSTGYLVFLVLINAPPSQLLGPRDWAKLSTLLQLSVASHMTQTQSVASKYTINTLLIGGRGSSITIVMEQKAPTEQHAKGSECCLRPKAPSCKDTHTQRRSGCSLQRVCSPPLHSGGYAGTHGVAGCQRQSHTSF